MASSRITSEVCVLQLVGQGPVAQKYMREAGVCWCHGCWEYETGLCTG